MNRHQQALKHMIIAALQCVDFLTGYGDGNYIFSNMVAKYTLSTDKYRFTEAALQHFIANGGDVNKVHSRSSLYGKKSPYMYEHAIPASVTREALKSNPENVDFILENCGEVIIALRTEDDILTNNGLQKCMSEGWKFGDDTHARYTQCGIALSNTYLNMKGAIMR